jgi:BlaI family transcriptional regulator, penicillinase repressor
MNKLTKAEEEIMKMFWETGYSLVSNLIEKMPDPKPPHSTVSSIVRILEKKGYVDHKAYGRTFEYFPVISKEEYSKFTINDVLENYFDDSPKSLVSFLVKHEKVDIKELSLLLEKLETEKTDKK